MLNKSNNTLQTAFSGNDTYQSGNDINIIKMAPIDIANFSFYEEDIKEIILFFNNNLGQFKDNPFPNNKSISIVNKNKLNNLSEEYFKDINENYLSFFGRIRDFLTNPKNSTFVNMYNSTASELNAIVMAIRPSLLNFDAVFPLLYSRIIELCKHDKNFMKTRTKIYLFLHFMYYNCDIGKKDESEYKLKEEI